MDDSDYLRLLTIQAEQANAFLSNARKWERERWVCQRLLQGLNIPPRRAGTAGRTVSRCVF